MFKGPWIIKVDIDIAFFILILSRLRFTFVIVADLSALLFVLGKIIMLLLLYNVLRRLTVPLLNKSVTLAIFRIFLSFLCSAFT